jgi:hypothetical protein
MTAEYQVDGEDRRVAVCYTVALTGVAAAAALASDPRALGPFDPKWPGLAGVLCAGLAVLTPLRRQARAAAVVRAACCLAMAGWLSWGCRFGIWDSDYWLALGCGAVVLGWAAAVFATPTDWGGPARIAQPARPSAVEPDDWSQRIAQATKGRVTGATVVQVEEWETGNGRTVFGQMPATGDTWEALQPAQAALAAVLRLPAGGGVTAGPWGDAAGFRLDVLERDAMAQAPAYPGLE